MRPAPSCSSRASACSFARAGGGQLRDGVLEPLDRSRDGRHALRDRADLRADALEPAVRGQAEAAPCATDHARSVERGAPARSPASRWSPIHPRRAARLSTR